MRRASDYHGRVDHQWLSVISDLVIRDPCADHP